MEKQIFELLTEKRQKDELALLDAYNQKTEKFGLTLTEQEAKELIVRRNESLKKYGRVEFGRGILDKIVYNSAIPNMSARKIISLFSPDCRTFFIILRTSLRIK